MIEKTFAMIKSDGVKKGLIGECIKRIENAEMIIIDMKMMKLSKKLAHKFREDIRKKFPNIYDSLIDYMTEGNVVAMIIKGENAVKKLKDICGPTNPKEAPKGTIRGDYGEDDLKLLFKKDVAAKNIIHASGNMEEAKREINLFFN